MNQVMFKRVYVDKYEICWIELTELFELLPHPKVVTAAQRHHQPARKAAQQILNPSINQTLGRPDRKSNPN